MSRHRGADPGPDDVDALESQWHIGRYWPGLFPHIEANCPCPKAVCGLVIPSPYIDCAEHHGQRTIRQAHRVEECKQLRKLRGRRSAG